jgi:hypothetical protein
MTLHADPTYPAASAFVVKLHRDGDPAAGHWRGRVEHIASGQHRDFARWSELQAWLCRMCPVHPHVHPHGHPPDH